MSKFCRNSSEDLQDYWSGLLSVAFRIGTRTSCNCSYLSLNTWFPTMWHLTSVDSDEPVQPPFQLRNAK